MTELRPDDDLLVDIRKLPLITDMANLGARGVAETLAKMTGESAEMEVTRTSFAKVADLESSLGDGERVGVRVRLTEPPHGHLLLLFEEASARRLTDLMLSDVGGDVDAASGELARSAVKEIGSMMLSGFVDGWADVLGTGIDYSTPQLVYAPAGEVVERTAGLGDDDHALVIDSSIEVPGPSIEGEIYALPRLSEFVALINDIEVAEVGGAERP